MGLVGAMLSLIEGIINALHFSVVPMGSKSLLSIKNNMYYVGDLDTSIMYVCIYG